MTAGSRAAQWCMAAACCHPAVRPSDLQHPCCPTFSQRLACTATCWPTPPPACTGACCGPTQTTHRPPAHLQQLLAVVPLRILHLLLVGLHVVVGGLGDAANHELAGAVAPDGPRLRAHNMHLRHLHQAQVSGVGWKGGCTLGRLMHQQRQVGWEVLGWRVQWVWQGGGRHSSRPGGMVDGG